MTKKLSLMVAVSLIAAAGLGYAAGNANIGTMGALDDVQWQEIRPGSPVSLSVLWGDPTANDHGRLIRLPAGFVVPIHAHTGDYHAVNLTGTWRHSFEEGQEREERELPTGSYVFQPGTAMHGDSCVGPEDCVLFLHQHEPADFIAQE